MVQDVRTFLKRFSMNLLITRLILYRRRYRRGPRYELKAGSVGPLIKLMKEHNVTKLVAEDMGWYLTSDRQFRNPGSGEIREGSISDLRNQGEVFTNRNRDINPYYDPQSAQESPIDDDVQDELPTRFGPDERELQRALRDNIAQLDAGLRIVDGGVERTVESGRIDIKAEDDRGNLVVIELKSGTAAPEAVAQLLGYMGAIENPDGRPIRGILVANDFHQRAVYAAKAVPNISLKAYSFQFSFEDR